MNSMIIQSKKSKKSENSGHRFDCRPKKRTPSSFGTQKAHAPSVFNSCAFLLCTKPDTTEDLRLDLTKLKILKKFPKIKASIPSCDSKLLFFLSSRSKQIKI